jgi:hypothetical protein
MSTKYEPLFQISVIIRVPSIWGEVEVNKYFGKINIVGVGKEI